VMMAVVALVGLAPGISNVLMGNVLAHPVEMVIVKLALGKIV